MRIAISTGGGDAPGLNAVIRAVVLSAHHRGWHCYGIQRGYEGLLSFNGVVPLGPAEVRGITHLGGTILGTTNRGNPFRYISRDEHGHEMEIDRSDDLVAAFQASGFDALVSIGGDGSLQISHQLWCKGLPVVCVPKTIDNDVSGTQRSFGFDSAVSTATEALDKVHSTAESHDRVIVVELMGRYAGWIALYSGLSGSADVILLPEIPFDIEKVCNKIRAREAAGRRFSIVVVAEGARPQAAAISSWSSVAASARWIGSAASPARWRGRSSSAPARRPAPSCWGTSSAAARPRRTTGCSRSGSAARRSAPSPTVPSAPWSGSTGPTSPGCRSPRSWAGPRTFRSMATSSPPRVSWGSAWETDPSMPTYPLSRTSDAVEILHGETIPDPYRWLEDGESADTRQWTDAQNALTRSYLDAVPARERIRARLDQLLAIGVLSVPAPVRGRYFYQRRDGRQNQPVLYLRQGVGGEDRPIVDPNALDTGGTVALDWYYPSDDGRLLAYGLSNNGSEQSVLQVMDVDTGVVLPDRIPHTRAADLAWLPDSTGFYYTRYPAPGETPEGEEHYHRAVYFHRLGTDPAGTRWSSSQRKRSTGRMSGSRPTDAGW